MDELNKQGYVLCFAILSALMEKGVVTTDQAREMIFQSLPPSWGDGRKEDFWLSILKKDNPVPNVIEKE